jgi:ADP-ribose pyrophosphatase
MSRIPSLESTKLLLQTKKFSVAEELFKFPDGETISKNTILHPGAVLILPLDVDGRICFIKQYRYAIRAEILELPAGTLEPGEAPLVCARRELAEEIGAQAEKWQSLGVLFLAPGISSEVMHLYFATSLNFGTPHPEKGEEIEIFPLTVSDALTAIADGRISDAKTIAAVTRALPLLK